MRKRVMDPKYGTAGARLNEDDRRPEFLPPDPLNGLYKHKGEYTMRRLVLCPPGCKIGKGQAVPPGRDVNSWKGHHRHEGVRPESSQNVPSAIDCHFATLTDLAHLLDLPLRGPGLVDLASELPVSMSIMRLVKQTDYEPSFKFFTYLEKLLGRNEDRTNNYRMVPDRSVQDILISLSKTYEQECTEILNRVAMVHTVRDESGKAVYKIVLSEQVTIPDKRVLPRFFFSTRRRSDLMAMWRCAVLRD